MQVNILESKNHLSQLVRRAQQGEEVIIANRGVPAVKLVPVAPSSAKAPCNVLAWLQQHPLPAHARRTQAEIEGEIEREHQGWD